MLGRAKRVAMQYSPKNAIPYVSLVDAGTVELVRSAGVKLATSADLVQKFEACWSEAQLQSHLAAGRAIDKLCSRRFSLAAQSVREKKNLTEYDLQQWIRKRFEEEGVSADEGPDVAVNQNARIRTTVPRANPPPRSRKATCCCSMFGASKRRRGASITTSPGSAIWARRCRRNTRRFSE